MDIQAQQGDTLDLICQRYYGKTQGVTEIVLQANPGLCDSGPFFTAGQLVYLPEITEKASAEVVQLWD